MIRSDDAVARIKDYLGKLKALAPASAKPNYDELIKDLEAVQKSSMEFNTKELIKDLKEYVNDEEKLIPKLSSTDVRQHQVEIVAKLKKLIKTFESGKGTFYDLFTDFYQFIENKLALDV